MWFFKTSFLIFLFNKAPPPRDTTIPLIFMSSKVIFSSYFLKNFSPLILNINIRNEILKNHISFWLKTKDEILIQRIRKSAKRPLAYNVSDSDIQNMIKNRNKYYARAQNKIDCHNKTKKEIVDKILDII